MGPGMARLNFTLPKRGSSYMAAGLGDSYGLRSLLAANRKRPFFALGALEGVNQQTAAAILPEKNYVAGQLYRLGASKPAELKSWEKEAVALDPPGALLTKRAGLPVESFEAKLLDFAWNAKAQLMRELFYFSRSHGGPASDVEVFNKVRLRGEELLRLAPEPVPLQAIKLLGQAYSFLGNETASSRMLRRYFNTVTGPLSPEDERLKNWLKSQGVRV
eukprot:gnl/TRDRNA2_/TRDRNA2_88863_c1_seq1.p1 gnl/TRDRNA2_/TRDRNA2_88863_c1~~gnl/TRDRNA2_/TRDRNA2_88863_c1_seq1.p1  ORF type:complete len:256 (-),score=43.48 gnl/TRDRNA2_/TRDRNA2_88863_c1_seq1:37-690(-)